MTLTEFLSDRIAEDLEDITEAELHEPKRPDGITLGGYWEVEERHGFRYLAIRRARALVECEAKRRIVGIHQVEKDTGWLSGEPNDWLWCTRCGSTDDRPVAFPCDTLLALALPYADHPDYQQEWAL